MIHVNCNRIFQVDVSGEVLHEFSPTRLCLCYLFYWSLWVLQEGCRSYCTSPLRLFTLFYEPGWNQVQEHWSWNNRKQEEVTLWRSEVTQESRAALIWLSLLTVKNQKLDLRSLKVTLRSLWPRTSPVWKCRQWPEKTSWKCSSYFNFVWHLTLKTRAWVTCWGRWLIFIYSRWSFLYTVADRLIISSLYTVSSFLVERQILMWWDWCWGNVCRDPQNVESRCKVRGPLSEMYWRTNGWTGMKTKPPWSR